MGAPMQRRSKSLQPRQRNMVACPLASTDGPCQGVSLPLPAFQIGMMGPAAEEALLQSARTKMVRAEQQRRLRDFRHQCARRVADRRLAEQRSCEPYCAIAHKASVVDSVCSCGNVLHLDIEFCCKCGTRVQTVLTPLEVGTKPREVVLKALVSACGGDASHACRMLDIRGTGILTMSDLQAALLRLHIDWRRLTGEASLFRIFRQADKDRNTSFHLRELFGLPVSVEPSIGSRGSLAFKGFGPSPRTVHAIVATESHGGFSSKNPNQIEVVARDEAQLGSATWSAVQLPGLPPSNGMPLLPLGSSGTGGCRSNLAALVYGAAAWRQEAFRRLAGLRPQSADEIAERTLTLLSESATQKTSEDAPAEVVRLDGSSGRFATAQPCVGAALENAPTSGVEALDDASSGRAQVVTEAAAGVALPSQLRELRERPECPHATTRLEPMDLSASGLDRLLGSEHPSPSIAQVQSEGLAASPQKGAAGRNGESSRYSTGLMTLLFRAYGKKRRTPPDLCACVPRPVTPEEPREGADGHLSVPAAWESYANRVAEPSSHARNCEFAASAVRLQRQILVLIAEAKAVL